MWLHWFRKASRHKPTHLISLMPPASSPPAALHILRQRQRHDSTDVSSGAATHQVVQQDGIMRLEPLAAHDSTIVWLHGMGQSGGHWVEPGICVTTTADSNTTPLRDTVEDSILPHLPHCRVLLPTAPLRPVGRLQGARVHAWMDSEGHSNRFDERCLGLEVCAHHMHTRVVM